MPQPSSKSQGPTDAFIEEYSRYTQFHGISDSSLIRLAERKTGQRVSTRWVAIALILRNPIPIPVPESSAAIALKKRTPTPPAKLKLVVCEKRKAPASGRKTSSTNWLTW